MLTCHYYLILRRMFDWTFATCTCLPTRMSERTETLLALRAAERSALPQPPAHRDWAFPRIITTSSSPFGTWNQMRTQELGIDRDVTSNTQNSIGQMAFSCRFLTPCLNQSPPVPGSLLHGTGNLRTVCLEGVSRGAKPQRSGVFLLALPTR